MIFKMQIIHGTHVIFIEIVANEKKVNSVRVVLVSSRSSWKLHARLYVVLLLENRKSNEDQYFRSTFA